MTTDPNDRASEQEEQMRAAAMRFQKPTGPRATGYCLHCEELVWGIPLPRWCNAAHRDLWEKEQR